MSEARTVRFVTVADAAAIREIYAHYVQHTSISFESVPPTEAEMGERIEQTASKYPWLVCEREGEVIGFAYASQHRTRDAYRWSVDVANYVRRDSMRLGIGRLLYEALLAQLDQLGYANAFACITLPNEASVAIHEKMGFTHSGTFRKDGFKMGQWHDVGWWQRSFNYPDAPGEPRCRDVDSTSMHIINAPIQHTGIKKPVV